MTFFVVKTGEWSRKLSFDTVQQHGEGEIIPIVERGSLIGVKGLFVQYLKAKRG